MKLESNLPLVTYIVLLLTGIAVFIIGMNMMSSGLKQLCGRGVKNLFKKTEKSKLANFGIGASVTALIQSSAATNIMAIGFVSAGVMTIYQAIAVTMGASVGTTITGVLVSFSGFSISLYFLLLAAVGVVMMFFKHETVKQIGAILAGLGLLFFGLETMGAVFQSSTVIKDGCSSFCKSIETLSISPIIFLLLGALITACLQSSSATSGIVIVMVGEGAISFASGMYLVIGATIGTVVTTYIASIGGNSDVKKVTVSIFIMKVTAAILGLAILWPLEKNIANFFATCFVNTKLGLAIFLVIFNLLFMGAMLPFSRKIVDLCSKLVKEKVNDAQANAIKHIDKNFLNSPSIAMSQVRKEIIDMFDLSFENFKLGYNEVVDHDFTNSKELLRREEEIDYINEAVADYLIALSNKVTSADERAVGSYFHIINDIERIGDHAKNFHDAALQMVDNELKYSSAAVAELGVLAASIYEMFNLARETLVDKKCPSRKRLEELEKDVSKLKSDYAQAHFTRITKNTCTMELSPFYCTFLAELERVADHLANIGYSFDSPVGDSKEHKLN